jgi:hypothetical protein
MSEPTCLKVVPSVAERVENCRRSTSLAPVLIMVDGRSGRTLILDGFARCSVAGNGLELSRPSIAVKRDGVIGVGFFPEGERSVNNAPRIFQFSTWIFSNGKVGKNCALY